MLYINLRFGTKNTRMTWLLGQDVHRIKAVANNVTSLQADGFEKEYINKAFPHYFSNSGVWLDDEARSIARYL